jgi:hypothetical protein
MPKHLIKVFQTSSIVAFNKLFEHFNCERKLATLFYRQGNTTTITQVLTFAEQ